MSFGSSATLDGNFVFGIIFEMTTGDDDHELQQNSYFGLTGIETINGGGRGRRTNVSGQFVADDLPGLAFLERNLRSFRDGRNHVLVECDGTTWFAVQLFAFNPSGQRKVDVNTGQCLRNYTATFWHAF